MKILLASGSGIYDKAFPETRKNQSGFGIMIRALTDMLQKNGDELDIITMSNITPGRKIGNATLLKKKWGSLIFRLKPFYIKKAMKINRAKDLSFNAKLKNILYFMTGSYAEYIIKKNKYDVVHINGIGVGSVSYMYACIRTSTPFVVTLHGLNSFNPKIRASLFTKNMERVFFKVNKDNEKALATVISTGIKNRLCDVAGGELDAVHVVCNPVIQSSEAGYVPYKKEDGEKVIVCVGNISENKNQRLVVDAFARMQKEHEGKYKLFVIGGGEDSLREYAEKNNIENITFTGAIEKPVVNEYYKIADLCVMASIDEGFGLSLVEGYSYGVPCVMPTAIDAYPDLYEEYACIGAENYEIPTFANSLYTALTREWDKEKIKKKAEAFTEESRADAYLSVLKEAKKFGTAPFDISTMDEIIKLAASSKLV